jgi:hypothetical protein
MCDAPPLAAAKKWYSEVVQRAYQGIDNGLELIHIQPRLAKVVEGVGYGHWDSNIDLLWPMGGKVPLSILGMPFVNGKKIWGTSGMVVVAQLLEVQCSMQHMYAQSPAVTHRYL